MSQFDFYTFSVQVFWTLSGFFTFYFFILRYYLTSFAAMFKMREKLQQIANK
jgi:phage shock protein PspC (stress-responsive transcriptional regulator)